MESLSDGDDAVLDLTQVTLDEEIRCAGVPTAGLLELLKAEKYCDVAFVVEGKRVKAHRLVLASQCEYFDKLLFGHLKEANSEEIVLHDTPAVAFNCLLQYLYSGYLLTKIDIQTALDLLCLADRYQLIGFKSSLESALSHHLCIDTLFQLFFYAEAYNCSHLQQKCTTFIESNTRLVLCSKVILTLPFSHFRSFISRDQLLVEEVVVFETVQKWIAKNEPSPKQKNKLLKCIRLSEMSSSQLKEKVMSCGLFDPPTVSKALEEQRDSAVDEDIAQGRGRAAIGNLFSDASTKIKTFENFKLKNKCFGEAFRGFPSCYSFCLLSRATHKPSHITLELSDQFFIDELKFVAYTESWGDDEIVEQVKEPFSYKIEVSNNLDSWKIVVDHSKYKCYFSQQLYFQRRSARYVRLTIVRAHDGLQVRLLSCSCQTDVKEPPFKCVNHVLAPVSPLCPVLIHHTTEILGGVRLFLTLHQPYSISSFKARVCGLMGSGHVIVSISIFNKTKHYQVVADLKDCILDRSELQISFMERVVSIITIDILHFTIEGHHVPLTKDTPITVRDVFIGQALVN